MKMKRKIAFQLTLIIQTKVSSYVKGTLHHSRMFSLLSHLNIILKFLFIRNELFNE